ncbi:hypothetical protein ACLKA7_016338 [Drosophila subpalustris]
MPLAVATRESDDDDDDDDDDDVLPFEDLRPQAENELDERTQKWALPETEWKMIPNSRIPDPDAFQVAHMLHKLAQEQSRELVQAPQFPLRTPPALSLVSCG